MARRIPHVPGASPMSGKPQVNATERSATLLVSRVAKVEAVGTATSIYLPDSVLCAGVRLRGFEGGGGVSSVSAVASNPPEPLTTWRSAHAADDRHRSDVHLLGHSRDA